MSNNAAQRACGRRNGPSPNPTYAAGTAAIHTLIDPAKLNSVDPFAWLADMLTRLQDISQTASKRCFPAIGVDSYFNDVTA